MRTLVALLGRSPGTVTATFYALLEAGHGPIDRIVTLTTDDRPAADGCERLIRDEIEDWQDEQEDATGKRPTWPVFEPRRISARDLEDEASSDEFQSEIGAILRQELEQGRQVYLGLAGGRKSMAALAAIAAQFIGADKIKMFHLYVTNRDLEECGDVDKLRTFDCAHLKHRVMHPQPDDYVLVEVPFGAQSRVNEFIYREIQRNPNLLRDLPDPDKENLWGYHYEVKVAEYIHRERGSAPKRYQFDRTEHRYPLRDRNRTPLRGVPRLDVYAERDERDRLRVLIGECKLSLSERADRDKLLDGLYQLRRDQQKIEDFVQALKVDLSEIRPIEFERWLITNTPQVSQDILDQAQREGVQIMYARTPHNWKTNVEWQVDQLRLAEPLPEAT